MRTWILMVATLAACGGDDNNGAHDAAMPDSPPDAAIDAPPPPLNHAYMVEDHMKLPTTNNEARADALDLDGDAAVDNQFGMVVSTLNSMGLNVAAGNETAVSKGTFITLLDLYNPGPAGTFASFIGATPAPAACAGATDMTCRHHLTGSATFTVPAGSVTNTPLDGTWTGTTFDGGPGHLAVQMAWPDAAPVTLTLIGTRVHLTQATTTAIGAGVIDGGITPSDINTKVIPAMRDSFQAQVARDCNALTSPPACGCADNSSGKTVLGLFDANHNCDISVDEVRNNSLIVSLLTPDVTLEAMQCLSFGFAISAVGAGYVAP